MKKIIIFTLTFLFILGCKSDKNNKVKNNDDEKIEVSPIKNALVISKITSNQIPKSISYKGTFKEGYIWKNKNEDNIIFITETGEFLNINEEGRDAELFAYCYNSKTGKLVWKVYDFIKDCPVDIIAEFTNNTFNVTDLNKNGIAEVWLMYETACKGDVSPNDMKIIMYEGKQKFAMRGQNKIQLGIDENNNPVIDGGAYKFDKAFTSGPQIFKSYAQKLWAKHL